MENWQLHTIRAGAQAKAAGLQHEVAQAVPHGFKATSEDKARYWMERDVEAGMWANQRRAAGIATACFLKEHKGR